MHRDPTEFRERFKRWKAGERVYDSGQALPAYEDGKSPKYDTGVSPIIPPVYSPTILAHRIIFGKNKRAEEAMYNSFDPTGSYPELNFDGINNSINTIKNLFFGYVRPYLKNYIADPHTKKWEFEKQDIPDTWQQTADAAWRRRLHQPYDKNRLPYVDKNTATLPKDIELEIPVDTFFLKKRIRDNERLALLPAYKNNEAVNVGLDADKEMLAALRKTYATGEEVTTNEMAYNNRNWIKNGATQLTISPLSLLQNYTIQYDKKNNRMKYSDIYDFNEFEYFVPGESFNIKGSIDLNPLTEKYKHLNLKTQKKKQSHFRTNLLKSRAKQL